MKTIDYKGKTYTCPFSDSFRRHTKAEQNDLAENIREVGLLHPIVIYHDSTLGLYPCVLDGEGRLTAISKMPLAKVDFIDRGELTTEQAYQEALGHNDRRRHDNPDAIAKRKAERLERVAAARAEGKSLRTIAAEEGVSLVQVQRDTEEIKSTVPPGTVEPEKIIGMDGRVRTATPKKKEPEPVKIDETSRNVKTAEVQSNIVESDKVLVSVPLVSPSEQPDEPVEDLESSPAQAFVKECERIAREIDKVVADVRALAGNHYCHTIHTHSVLNTLRDARETIWSSRPAYPCPYCNGNGRDANNVDCDGCRGRGCVTKATYKGRMKGQKLRGLS